jgi:hypothetical protein
LTSGAGLAGLLEHAGELGAHAVVLHHQAGGRVDQAGGHAHVFGLVLERFLELGQQRLEGFGGFFGGLLLGLVLQLAQIDRALGHAAAACRRSRAGSSAPIRPRGRSSAALRCPSS